MNKQATAVFGARNVKSFALTCLALTSLAIVDGANAATAPQMGITSFEQLSGTLPLPYAENANADQQIAEARSKALRGRKLLLIDLGGNWCLDCRLLAGTMEHPPLKAWMARHYEIVTVNIGRYDKNQQVQARYGIRGRLAGVPAVLIVDPKTNRLMNPDRITALADARSMSPQGLADWLASWVR